MKHKLILPALFVLLCNPLMAFSDTTKPAAADNKEHKKTHTMPHQEKAKKHAHHFSAHWAKTLSDKQKSQVDQMHLALNRELLIIKAREDLAQKEVNSLTTQDNANIKTINAKLDELGEIKKEIMRARYAHLLEMRAILTPAQRVTYDMSILKRSGVK